MSIRLNIGFIGLGRMKLPMSRNALRGIEFMDTM